MIRKKPFGKTGHNSTVTIFGAAAFWDPTQSQVDCTFDTLFEYGINHIDTAADYNRSEEFLGPWMKHHRDKFFLATKTGERTYEKAKADIHRSLDRLQTDHVDLLQLHCLIDEDEWQTAMGPEGALEAVIEARDAGLIRFIGVTGHNWQVARMHLKSLGRYAFDSVLLPLNYHMLANPRYRKEFFQLKALCDDKNVAFQTIKAIARGPWGESPKTRTPWYMPYEDQADIDRCVHYVLGHEGAFLNTVADVDLLPRIFDAAQRFAEPPSELEMQRMAETTNMQTIFEG